MSNTFQVSKLGEYRIIKDIAAGTFGKVKLAQHVLTGQHVAMKFISKADSRGSKNRIRSELKYMRQLRHPHIIKLYELLSTETDIIFVLEYAGGELFDYIVTHGKMPEPRARKFFQQIISGIEYSHRRKIVHRDLKPENLLLDEDLNVKIADFGLSSDISDGAFLSTSCGSPNYAAPEVIRGGVYAGPEIDVWSCGVILYVMLCGKLPFEDENVHVLFTKISQGQFHMPHWLSPDAKSLISAMLIVDPVKRITVPEITQHPFFTKDLPRYLAPLPPENGPVLGSLSALVTPIKAIDFVIIDGLGRIDEDIIEELANKLEGVTKEDIWEALKADDGIPGNAIKVAYSLMKDQKMRGRDLAEYAEQERDAELAVLDPRHALSPSALSPAGENEPNPFEAEFDSQLLRGATEGLGTDDPNTEESDFEDILDDDGDEELTPYSLANTFAVLNSSLPEDGSISSPSQPLQQQHHLAAYATATRASAASPSMQPHLSASQAAHQMRKELAGLAKRTKWHFGIRSSSPPMEVMLEIYKTLKALGMEWKEKRNLGGLGGVPPLKDRLKERAPNGSGGRKVERQPSLDGHGGVDPRAASGIYFVETRARWRDVVVLMNIQLYMIESKSFLVDFHHKKTYPASTMEGAGKFDPAPFPLPSSPSNSSSASLPMSPISPADSKSDKPGSKDTPEDTISPFAFMDVACRLILHLAGYEE